MPSFSRSFLLSVLALSACTTTTTTTTGVPPTTEVVVDPALFLGDVACLDAPGAMRLYVATLTDISPDLGVDAAAPEMPSSVPTPCGVPVHFQRVVPNRQYVADIQGYDTTAIVPLSCWPNVNPLTDPHATCAGSPVMVDSKTGAYVAPRWATSCGRSGAATPGSPLAMDGGVDSCYLDGGQRLDGPVCAQYLTTVTLRGCEPMHEAAATPSPTAISVDLADALAGMGCDTPSGKIETFTAQIAGQPATAKTAACGGTVVFDGLDADVGYRVDVTATVADAGTPWTTSCFRTAVSGVTVRAGCDPFPELHGG
jgi:hypothetical protein